MSEFAISPTPDELNEDRYKVLFDFSPVPLWDEDLSQLKIFLDELKAQGVSDFLGYFDEHPEAVIACASRVQIRDVNHATLELLKAESKEQLLGTLETVLDEEVTQTFKEQIDKLARGFHEIRMESVNYAMDGTPVHVDVHFRIAPPHRDTWSSVIVSTVDISRRKIAEQQVIEYQRNLRQLSSELSTSEDRERRKIASLLHDDIGQMLALTRLKMAGISTKAKIADPECYQQAQEVDQTLREIIQKVRSLTFELSSPLLYDVGFEAAIEELGQQLNHSHAIEVSMVMNRTEDLFNEQVRGLLYRASRELIFNAIKHAQATTLEISSKQIDGWYHLSFKDNGVGFVPAAAGNPPGLLTGFGLFNIEEQLRNLGGTMAIDSQLNAGTRITLKVPI